MFIDKELLRALIHMAMLALDAGTRQLRFLQAEGHDDPAMIHTIALQQLELITCLKALVNAFLVDDPGLTEVWERRLFEIHFQEMIMLLKIRLPET